MKLKSSNLNFESKNFRSNCFEFLKHWFSGFRFCSLRLIKIKAIGKLDCSFS